MIKHGPVGYCPACNSYIQSLTRHDYHTCSCGASSIDGGADYTRTVGQTVVLGDIYDAHVHRLNQRPALIEGDWDRYGPLFNDIDASRRQQMCCPTLLRDHYRENFQADSLQQQVIEDERLPKKIQEVTLAHLPIFAEWQRLADKEHNRPPIPFPYRYDANIPTVAGKN